MVRLFIVCTVAFALAAYARHPTVSNFEALGAGKKDQLENAECKIDNDCRDVCCAGQINDRRRICSTEAGAFTNGKTGCVKDQANGNIRGGNVFQAHEAHEAESAESAQQAQQAKEDC
ncbi:hypothetical protein G6O67_006402 [Ophiocordyceps sinensis]|uniref:Biotrophy-associated secreted protein 2 n=2 Tax=Ophiocordyceps sinensis TaxID=72228 RepID=A0A8H4PMY9_9HYPO|nr:hypothetical protein OCS_05186 [Ophiocordyceps sinensis CO18]KAF4506304.1 hypothetical protein G6O67_006402 [Ophiocordyceps sinensis]